MSIVNSIISFLKNKEGGSTDVAPEGFCPNCWGRQEYEGQFFKAMKNQNVDINSIDDKKGWIQDYADKHLAGIQVKKQDGELVCSSCKVGYKPT